MNEIASEVRNTRGGSVLITRERELEALREVNIELARRTGQRAPNAPVPTSYTLNRLSSEEALARAQSVAGPGRYDEAASYYAHASTNRNLRDANYQQAFATSLKGEGVLVKEAAREAARNPVDTIRFVQELSVRPTLWRNLNFSDRRHLNQALQEISRSRYRDNLIPTQRASLDEMLRATSNP
jgi:hypothetical protein